MPIVIRRKGSARPALIVEGDPVYFPAQPTESTTAPGDAVADHTAEPTWRLEIVLGSGHFPAGKPLTDGSVVRLRSVGTHRYLAFGPSGEATEAGRRGAAMITVYKADFVNPDRPSTCDQLIRDDDYVYLRAIAPSRWLRAGSATAASLSTWPAAGAPLERTCSPGAERCQTDDRGAVQCAAIPCCGG